MANEEHIKALRRINEIVVILKLSSPKNFHKISRLSTIYMVFGVNKKIEVQFKFLEDMCHARESLHLKNKNTLRTFLGLKLKLSLIHISEPTRLLSISYAVFCLKKKNVVFILKLW